MKLNRDKVDDLLGMYFRKLVEERGAGGVLALQVGAKLLGRQLELEPTLIREVVTRCLQHALNEVCPTAAQRDDHVVWMILSVQCALDMPEDEFNRWVGFIQGALWSNHVYTIDEMREHIMGCRDA